MRIPGVVVAAALAALIGCGQAPAQTAKPAGAAPPVIKPIKSSAQGAPPTGYRLETVASGLDFPWGMVWLPDGAMLVTEKSGAIRLIRNGALDPTPVPGGPTVHYSGQGGLLDIALHPNFADNRIVYFSYAIEREEGGQKLNGTAVARARFDGKALSGLEEIYVRAPLRRGGMHYGGRLLFLPDGTLLLTLGDGFFFRNEAQDLDGQMGKTVRMTDAGAPAGDNPFRTGPDADPYVYTLGHRNVQGAAIDRASGRVYLHEHGAQGGDELNLLTAGVNYGWPLVSYGKNYDGTPVSNASSRPGLAEPLLYWVPSIAPSGLAFYDGDLFPQWRGDLFVGALKEMSVRRVDLDGRGRVRGEQILFREVGQRIRDVRTGPDGALYLLTDTADGRLIRVVPAA